MRALTEPHRWIALDEIKQLYYNATSATIQRTSTRAIELLKPMPDEDERERAAVYMDGLSQMRTEWAGGQQGAAAEANGAGLLELGAAWLDDTAAVA